MSNMISEGMLAVNTIKHLLINDIIWLSNLTRRIQSHIMHTLQPNPTQQFRKLEIQAHHVHMFSFFFIEFRIEWIEGAYPATCNPPFKSYPIPHTWWTHQVFFIGWAYVDAANLWPLNKVRYDTLIY